MSEESIIFDSFSGEDESEEIIPGSRRFWESIILNNDIQIFRQLLTQKCRHRLDNDPIATVIDAFILDAIDYGGSLNALLILIGYGVEVSRLSTGFTFLHVAVQLGYCEVAAFLISKCRSDVKAISEDGLTPLHLVSNTDDSASTVELLTDNGADIEARDNTGMTPLALACERGYICVIEALVSHGANTSSVNNRGDTILDIMNAVGAYDGKDRIIKILQECGDVSRPNPKVEPLKHIKGEVDLSTHVRYVVEWPRKSITWVIDRIKSLLYHTHSYLSKVSTYVIDACSSMILP